MTTDWQQKYKEHLKKKKIKALSPENWDYHN